MQDAFSLLGADAQLHAHFGSSDFFGEVNASGATDAPASNGGRGLKLEFSPGVSGSPAQAG
jgi:hypothetical protein